MPTARTRRVIFWTGLACIAALLTLGVGFVGWTLDPASLKPRLVEAAWRATGRTLTIAGPTRIKLALVPTITLEDVALANPPGFSRPEMVRIDRVELGLALLPLLRHRFVVDHVTLVRPDTVLETDAAGHPNWIFTRGAPPRPAEPPQQVVTMTAPATTPPAAVPPPARSDTPPPAPKRRVAVTFRAARLEDGHLLWIDGRTGHRYDAGAPLLTLDAPPDGPLRLSGTLTYAGRKIDLTAGSETTTVSGGPPGTQAWPVSVRLQTEGATLTAAGTIADLARIRDYAIAIDAAVPDPAALEPFFPRLPLASLKQVTAHLEVSDGGTRIPSITAMNIGLGSADLDHMVHGARLSGIALTGQATAPLKLVAKLDLGGVELDIAGSIGDLPWLSAGGQGPVAVDLEWNAGSAHATVKGTIQAPSRLAGVNLEVAANVPDPSLVMGDAPPALKAVMLRTHLVDAPGQVPFRLTSTAGDLTGLLSVSRPPPGQAAKVSVTGEVWSNHLDLDLLRSNVPVAPSAAAMSDVPADAGPPGRADDAPGSGAAQAPVAPPPIAPAPQAAAPVEPAPTGPVIPAMKLPFALLRDVDGTLRFSFLHVQVDGADLRKIYGAVAVKDGQLRLDPFTITPPGQHVEGTLTVDAARNPPSVHLTLEAPGLALRPLLGFLGLPPLATGTAAVRADLSGEGDTPRALAASLNGWAGLASEGGQLDARTMNAFLEELRGLHVAGAEFPELRCFAFRADAKAGVVTLRPLALNTPSLILEGGGDVDLRNETMALRLRPRTEIGKTGIALPVRVTGPWRSPSARIDISAGGPGGGMLAGLLLGGKNVMGAAGGGDPCPEALAQARAGAPAAPGEQK